MAWNNETWNNETLIKKLNETTSVVTITLATTSLTEEEMEAAAKRFMSDALQDIFQVVIYVILSGLVGFVGSILNIINIVVFVRQGLNDSITISLLALAISDLGSLSTLVWMSICYNPYFETAAETSFNFNSANVQYLTAAWPHFWFARLTSFLTAYITFERCLCIALPLKVKTILTTKRSIRIIASIFLFEFATVVPVFYAIRLDWVYDEARNQTLVDLSYVTDGPFIENISFSINVAIQIFTFISVIVCSLILVQGLREKSKWRQKVAGFGRKTNNNSNGNSNTSSNNTTDNSSSHNNNDTTARDKRVVKMVLSLAVIFIVCYLPTATNLIIMINSPQYSIFGLYKNLFLTGWSFLNTLEAINSSINVLVYYRMSSRFRQEFRRLFGCKEQ